MALLSARSFLRLPFDDVVEPFLDRAWHYDCIVSPKSRQPIACPLYEDLVAASQQAKTDKRSVGFPDSAAKLAPHCGDACAPRGSEPSIAAEELPRSIVPAQSSTTLLINGSTSSEALPESSLQSTEIDPQMLWLRNVFNAFDENSDGRLTTDELRRSLEKLGFGLTDESVLSLLSSIPLKEEGYIEIEEFLLLYTSTCCDIANYLAETDAYADDDEDLREAFNVFDKDRNGFITAEELQSVLCDLGFREAEKLESCVSMINRADEDGDGLVNFDEFKQLLVYSKR